MNKSQTQPAPVAHTPTPWAIFGPYKAIQPGGSVDIGDANGIAIAEKLKPDVAAFIVRACNSHKELVDALAFYANPDHWKKVDSGIGTLDGEAVDYGATAREALNSIEADVIATQPQTEASA